MRKIYALQWMLLIGSASAIRLIFTTNACLYPNRWKVVFSKSLLRPFKLFAYEPIMQLLGLYLAFIYGLLYRTYSGTLSYMPSYTLPFQYFLPPYPQCFKTCITTA